MGHSLQSLGLQLHGPLLATRPLAVVASYLERAEVLEADKGGGGEEFYLAQLDGQLLELREAPKLVRVHN